MKLSGLRLITALAGLPAIVVLPIIGCGTKKDAEDAVTVTVTVTDKAINSIKFETGDNFAVADAAGWNDKAILEEIQKKVAAKVTAADTNAKEVVAALVESVPTAPGAAKTAVIKFTVKAKEATDGTFSKQFEITVTQTA